MADSGESLGHASPDKAGPGELTGCVPRDTEVYCGAWDAHHPQRTASPGPTSWKDVPRGSRLFAWHTHLRRVSWDYFTHSFQEILLIALGQATMKNPRLPGINESLQYIVKIQFNLWKN